MEAQIQKALKKGPRTNRELRTDLGIRGTYDAKLDRALQRMRKDGKIKADKGRWFTTSVQVCPSCDGKGWVIGKSK